MTFRLGLSVSISVIVLSCIYQPAAAQLLEGKVVEYQYLYNTINTPFADADNGNKLVGSGVEVSSVTEEVATLDISDTNLYVDFVKSGYIASADFNGFRIADILNVIPPFMSVTINSATNLAGFNQSRITFDDDHIWVNWNDLNFTTNSVVSLDLNLYSVPEPAGSLFAATALLALLLNGRNKC